MMYFIRIRCIVVLLTTFVTTTAIAADSLQPLAITYLGTNKFLMIKVDEKINLNIESYNLDGIKNLENEVTKKITKESPLPDDPVEADRIATQRMDKLHLDKTMHIQQRMMHVIKGVGYLIQWDIKKLPAFVFENGKYVVYGVIDPTIAIQHYENRNQ